MMAMRKILIFTFCLSVMFAGDSLAEASPGQLAFVANIEGNWELFVVDEQGKEPIRLTYTPYDEKDPSWSYDRKKIVYATSDGQLNIINLNGLKGHQIFIEDGIVPRITPCFSPDGKKIAYVQFRPGARDVADMKIFCMEAKKSRKVIDQKTAQFWPAWSPDGYRIAYACTHCASDCGRIIQELWVVDPRGGYARQLLLTNALCQQPSWSPDGGHIAFSADINGNFDIWAVSLKDSKLWRITEDVSMDVSPTWSPDGNKIAFISNRTGRMSIWIKDMVTGRLKMLPLFSDMPVECKDVAWRD